MLEKDRPLSSDTPQQFTVAARDASASFDETQQIIKTVLSATPGARVVDMDPRNRLAVVEIPGHLVDTVRHALGHRFVVDPNAPLRY
jgi:hypothetical protein